jgi:DNA-binding CsgD family transcriptional regulator
MQIIELLVVGMTARELAMELRISLHTVRTHIRNIYSKIEVANRLELAQWVQEQGPVDGRSAVGPWRPERVRSATHSVELSTALTGFASFYWG